MSLQDTGKFRNTKDQFYTKEHVAKKCIDKIIETIPNSTEYLWIEPSAGNGAFFNNIHFTKIGIDIEPHGTNIEKHDYLTWKVDTHKNSIVFGNPPFGRQSSLAKSFIKKSCQFATVIAFILPRSFTKPSMYNAFHLRYHLVYSVEIEPEAFLLNGESYNVHCVFQIWEKRDNNRIVDKKINPIGFKYVTETQYDIAIRRIGVNAGKCYLYGEKRSIQSHYFITFDKNIDTIVEKINNHVFPSNTVGPRSISKCETNKVLNNIINGLTT